MLVRTKLRIIEDADLLSLNWYTFADLSVEQLYAALKLRAEVFVVDQHCAYLDLDGKDALAIHLLGTENDELVGYIRLFPPTHPTDTIIIFGRVVTANHVRGKGYGKKLIHELLIFCRDNFPGKSIKCSAQHHLQQFYSDFGFKAYGDIYEEDSIPHIAMQKD